MNWPIPEAARPAGAEAVGMGKVTAQQAAEIQRIGGKQVQNAKPRLHPHHAAHQVVSGDQRTGDQTNIAAGTDECSGQHQRREEFAAGPINAMANCASPWLAPSWLSGLAYAKSPPIGSRSTARSLRLK